MTYSRDLWEIAGYNYGVVTLSDARGMGVPDVEVRKLASRGALTSYGNGVYTHVSVPRTRHTQFAVAVALVGEGSYLWGSAVFTLLQLGDFNPRTIHVATQKRVRRSLPQWLTLTRRTDLEASDMDDTDGIPSTTIHQALIDVKPDIPLERWMRLVHECMDQGRLTQDVFRSLMNQAEQP